MIVIVGGRKEDQTLELSKDIENDINNLRDQLKAQNIQDVNNHLYSYTMGTQYIDVVRSCEKLGDYVMNVVEARLGKPSLHYRGLMMNLEKKTVTVDGESVILTRTEFDLLQLFLSHRGQVLSRQEMMDTVWRDAVVTDRTVDVNITRLRKKLGPYASCLANRQGFGYLFEEKA